MSAIYGSNNGILDPNSNFYIWDKREIIDFNKLPNGNHVKNYTYNPKEVDNNYREKFQEYTNMIDGNDKLESSLNICSGCSDNQSYGVVRDLNSLDSVGRIFFSRDNIKRIQKLIRKIIYEKSNKMFIVSEDQEESDLLISMRLIYNTEGRYIPDHIVHQVKRLNLKLINYIIPDMITQIKQSYGYQKEINEPLKMINRPINDNVRGRKTLPSITSTWLI
jgi:hypothetical protein